MLMLIGTSKAPVVQGNDTEATVLRYHRAMLPKLRMVQSVFRRSFPLRILACCFASLK